MHSFSSRKNMRYAFCSFTSTAHILTLYAGLSGRRWHPSQSINMFQASYANHQSMAGYIRKFRNSAVFVFLFTYFGFSLIQHIPFAI